MSVPLVVLTLVENFERNLDAYRSGQYNETQVRRDFIDPLFKALGWDMDNSLGYAERLIVMLSTKMRSRWASLSHLYC
jgi:hypothetical protein